MDTETVTQRQTVMDITLEVPKGLTLESYDAALGDYGGCLLKPDAYVGGYAPDEWKAAGYVMRSAHKAPGTAVTSNGFNLFRLIRDTGPRAPVFSKKRGSFHDFNTGEDVPCSKS